MSMKKERKKKKKKKKKKKDLIDACFGNDMKKIKMKENKGGLGADEGERGWGRGKLLALERRQTNTTTRDLSCLR